MASPVLCVLAGKIGVKRRHNLQSRVNILRSKIPTRAHRQRVGGPHRVLDLSPIEVLSGPGA